MQYGTANIVESEELVRFIANQIERRFGDRTVSAMIDPLFTNRRSDTIALRKLVTEGARLFGKGDFAGSLRAYDKADGLIGRSNSLFDRLWIDPQPRGHTDSDRRIRFGPGVVAPSGCFRPRAGFSMAGRKGPFPYTAPA